MFKKNNYIAFIFLLLAFAVKFFITEFNKIQARQLIPLEVLFGNNNKKLDPTLSPDGNYIAYLASENNVKALWLKTINGSDEKAITPLDHDVETYIWLYDSSQILYITNKSLFGYSIIDGSTQEYISSKNALYFSYYNKHNPHNIIIGMSTGYSPWFDLYELNLKTKELKLKSETADVMTKWVSDAHLNIRGKVELLPEGGARLFVRDSLEDQWRLLLNTENDWSGLTFFSLDGNSLYYFADLQNSNTRKLIKIDAVTGKIIELAQDEEYDISGELLFDNETLEPLALAYTKERKHWIFFNKTIEKLFKLFETIDKGAIEVKSRTLDDTKWLLAFTKATGQVSYWLYDTLTQKQIFLFDQSKIFNKYLFSNVEPIAFYARDGMLIHGYLTLPLYNNNKNFPLVLLVQKDSWQKNTVSFNPEVQWLANRGYAVLQVNARGTLGYGKKFFNAGNKQWGQAIQNDLTDAVYWAINNKGIDSKRIAIFGKSYGGYAALMGAIITPELYQCAVDESGPVDLMTLFKSFSPYWKNIFTTRVGNPETEEEFLQSISPINKVDEIKIPLLIAQGAHDPRVKQAESEQIVEAMKAKGLEYEYLLFPDEGHGFVRQENRLKFYGAAEKFLAKYLGGRYEK